MLFNLNETVQTVAHSSSGSHLVPANGPLTGQLRRGTAASVRRLALAPWPFAVKTDRVVAVKQGTGVCDSSFVS